MNVEYNKIYNVDSYIAIKDMADNSVDCVYTDIPYLYQKGGSSPTLLGDRMVKMNEELKDMSDGIDYAILDDFIRIMKRVNIFIWCSKSQLLTIMNYFNDFNVNFELLTWNKTNPVPRNNSWNSDIEYCLVFREKNFPLKTGYSLKSKWYTSPINITDKKLYDHPSIKPLNLVKRHLEHTTKENDIVFDPFLGSGTTAVACKELNRKYIGFENKPKYFDVAKKRINGITANGQIGIFTDLDKL